ncbi:omega-aminotransferase AptA [Sphingosinicella rhizophila]|uniref:Aminotransferase class III-fold pyridoxal phosphate-dependent enzyme n=1 Tax=Sphingosinicella rhizophila TaxID=3050082 RepID=A0ABU3Q6X6_9SPHN|nr:aminotransferase class III-fold pyridoxal phosphate-dependent enzyme [Sphingosinicella sp. GR2756]MDT9599151.1 aminotransferase class III-fold pyridoxal phosphate-dependent enzyme [Sphingosinicella sp. GR2756]
MKPDNDGAGTGREGLSTGLSNFWMPFTDNRGFKAEPRLLASAEGMYYRTPEGRQVLDGTAGLWCVNAGHGRREIVEAIGRQAATLDFGPTFQLGHPQAFELAEALAALMPAGLDRIFFTNSGSESADTALKMALAYHRANGESGRTRLIGRERGYHGTNMGGTSVGGIGGNRRSFGAQVWGVDHLAATLRPEAAFTRGQPDSNEDMAGELERLVALHGPETIAAVIVEPVACSTGVLVPPRGYLERLREITARHGILLIFDEVITAFGRLGAPTAAEYFGIAPDILTMAKGLTNAAVPMGAVAARRFVYDRIVDAAPPGIEFFHGYTYSGHPLAAAAGLATLSVYRQDELFARAAGLSSYWQQAVHRLQGARHVVDIRNLGLIAGIELAPRPDAPGKRAFEIFHRCFDDGLLIRVTGDIIALSPPLIVSEAQIDEIVDRIGVMLKVVD